MLAGCGPAVKELNGELADWRDGESRGRPDPTQPHFQARVRLVTDHWARAGPTVAELEAVLLEAKLSAPHRRAGSVSRAGLIETARARDCRVVGITAPAGYGKSTLMAEWAETEHRRVAWVSLDRLDDDPSALLSLLASAYARISGHTDLVADMRGLGVSALGHAAPRLASALRTSPVPFVLMLDDLHELRSPACHDVLSVVISGIPHGSQLVAASRCRAASPAAVAGFGRRGGDRGRRPGPGRRGRRADLRRGPRGPHP